MTEHCTFKLHFLTAWTLLLRKLDSMLLGKQIKNIIDCEGFYKKERHEKFDKCIQRLELVPLRYIGRIEAKNLL